VFVSFGTYFGTRRLHGSVAVREKPASSSLSG